MASETEILLEKAEKIAEKLWKFYSASEVLSKLKEIWDRKYQPLLPIDDREKLYAVVLGSGSFSTGREAIRANRELQKKTDNKVPIEYAAVVTNNKNSGARKVSEEFKVTYIELDFQEWKRENGYEGSTKLFGFPPGKEPDKQELERRLGIRKLYEKELLEKIEDEIGCLPDTVDLRGFNSVLVERGWRNVDNTHPANLTVREPNGAPRYAGWQEEAYKKMEKDGKKRFPASLIRVEPITQVSDLNKVDAGELLAISYGNLGEYTKREDHFVILLKASGLLGLWGISEKPKYIEYIDKDGYPVYVLQKEIVVVDKIKSGKEAFGSRSNDLEIINSFIRHL